MLFLDLVIPVSTSIGTMQYGVPLVELVQDKDSQTSSLISHHHGGDKNSCSIPINPTY